MSAPEIPNLLDKLRASRGKRAKPHDAKSLSTDSGGEQRIEEKNRVVQATDDDASAARWSAVRRGYLQDEYAQLFAKDLHSIKYPIINRGTYVRTSAIDHLIHSFLITDRSEPKQIISLGAGTDTRYFRLRQQFPDVKLYYHELDFSANTRNKIAVLRRKPSPLDVAHDQDGLLEGRPTQSAPANQPLTIKEDALYSPAYGLNIHPVDLRSLGSEQSELPSLSGVQPNVPTLILSEMCLCYLTPQETAAVIRSLIHSYVSPKTPASLILYEPIRPFDSFGKVMISNLASRNITLPTLAAYPTLSSQKNRLKEAGFTSDQGAADINLIWNKWIPSAEKERVTACEFLDEIEEWVMLAQHYCIAWAWRDGHGVDKVSGEFRANTFSRAWREVIGDGKDDDMPGLAQAKMRNPFSST